MLAINHIFYLKRAKTVTQWENFFVKAVDNRLTKYYYKRKNTAERVNICTVPKELI